MFLSTGSANKKGKPQFESKNTVKSKSKLKVFPAKQGWVHLALSRIDNTFYQLYRFEGEDDWHLLRAVERPEMPQTVQVGMLAYTDFWPLFKWFLFKNTKKFNEQEVNGKPDLIARYEFVKFRVPQAQQLISSRQKDAFIQKVISNDEVNALSLE